MKTNKGAWVLRQGSSSGFSLIELLVVIAIIGIIGALAFASPGIWKATNVTTAANLVTDDLALARETAVSTNEPVEVWFLRATGTTSVNALCIFLVDESGSYTSNGPVHHLPANVIIDSGSYLSPLIVTSTVKSWGTSSKPSIPGYQTSYDAWFVRFMPDGSTTLAITQQWYLTLHESRFGDQLAALPVNYAMVGLDPLTGSDRLYRP